MSILQFDEIWYHKRNKQSNFKLPSIEVREAPCSYLREYLWYYRVPVLAMFDCCLTLYFDLLFVFKCNNYQCINFKYLKNLIFKSVSFFNY